MCNFHFRTHEGIPHDHSEFEQPTTFFFRAMSLFRVKFAAVIMILGTGCYSESGKDQPLDGIACNLVDPTFWNVDNCGLSNGDQVWYSHWTATSQGTASIRFMKVTGISVDEAANARSTIELRHSLRASEEELSEYIRDTCNDFGCSIPTWFNLAYSQDKFDWYCESRGQTSVVVFAFDHDKSTCFYWTFFER